MKIILNAKQTETVANLAQTVDELAGSDKVFSEKLNNDRIKERIKAVQRRLVPLWDEDGAGIPLKVKIEVHIEDICWPWSFDKESKAISYDTDHASGLWERYEEKAKKKREQIINFVQGEIDAINAEIRVLAFALDISTADFWHEFLKIY